MDSFMKRAVRLAADNVRDGGEPFGAVLVKDNHIIVEAVNELHKTYDVSAHAELLAIRRIQKRLQTDDLSGYTMYASGEPCPMCLTAMADAGITDIYYCTSLADSFAVGLGDTKDLYADLENLRNKMVQLPLQQKEENPLTLWKKQHGPD